MYVVVVRSADTGRIVQSVIVKSIDEAEEQADQINSRKPAHAGLYEVTVYGKDSEDIIESFLLI